MRGIPFKGLPLTADARHLVEEFARHRPDGPPDYRKNVRTLTYLVYWLGAETAFFEREVHDLAALDANLAAAPVCKFLRDQGLLVQDPDLHQDTDQVWIEAALAALPQPLAGEMTTWVAALRGRRRAAPRGYDGIRRYLALLQPALTAWSASGVTTLKQISPSDAKAALDGLGGHTRRGRAVALRSVFQTLKRERVIFCDPTRDLPVGDLTGLPKAVPSDLLAGLLDQATTPLARLVIALVAIHALPGHQIACLHTVDLDLSRGTLQARRGPLCHTLYLEDLTYQFTADWLTYRHRQWPASTNPHLLVSQKSAVDLDHPAVSVGLLRAAVPRGLTLQRLRQDRILNEAADSADPLKLMRLFGVTEPTALRYVAAARPERTAKLPR
ncbi:hypothetical protein ACIBF1_21615 [Spirillospora sp. NPDC050679]